MRSSTLVLGAALAVLPVAAHAQFVPGSELVGQSVQVETGGTVNTIHFDPGGAARIMTPRGGVIPASWTSGPSGLCLNANGAQECWSYASPMAAGQAVAMTSSCGAVSTWNPAGTNAPPPPPPQQPSAEGERG
jgi:hypothetical protein